MVELPDVRVIKLVRQVEQERQARLTAEHQARGLQGQLTTARRQLAAAMSRTIDAVLIHLPPLKLGRLTILTAKVRIGHRGNRRRRVARTNAHDAACRPKRLARKAVDFGFASHRKVAAVRAAAAEAQGPVGHERETRRC